MSFYFEDIPFEGNDWFDLSFGVEGAPNMDVATEIRRSNLTQWNMFCSYVTFPKMLSKNKNKKVLIDWYDFDKKQNFSYYKTKL